MRPSAGLGSKRRVAGRPILWPPGVTGDDLVRGRNGIGFLAGVGLSAERVGSFRGGSSRVFRLNGENGIHLRLLEIRDAEQVLDLIDGSRPYLREWLPWVDATRTVQDVQTFIHSGLQSYVANSGRELGIWRDGRLAGVIGLHYINWTHRLTSIGYWLGEEFQARGIMTTACRTLIDFLIGEYQLNRFEIRAATENFKSRAIPERLGFTNEGTQRQAEWLYDHFVDHVIYGMLAEEWGNDRG